MKFSLRHFSVLAALLLSRDISSAQSGWFWQNPLPQGNTLTAVQFINDSLAYAVGASGTFMKSTDAGISWSTQHYIDNSQEVLAAMSFVDELTGWVVGSNGVIFRTTDGGISWSKQSSGIDKYLFGVSFTDAYHGTATGMAILHTSDGGATWIPQDSPSGFAIYMAAVCFVDSNTGTAVGILGKILHTTNGGSEWKEIDYISEYYDLFAVDFFDATHGVAVGINELTYGGAVLTTTDGGYTWIDRSFGAFRFNAVRMTGPSSAVIGSNDGIFATTDMGQHWAKQIGQRDYHAPLGISFYGAKGLVVGQDGEILGTTDGGSHWTLRSSGYISPYTLNAVRLLDPMHGIAVGGINEGIMLKTADGGDHWIREVTDSHDRFLGLSFANSTVGTLVGNGFDSVTQQATGLIMRTTDAGTTWLRQESGLHSWLWGVHLVDTAVGFAVGDDAIVIKTTDGGKTWEDKSPGRSWEVYYSAAFADEKHGVVVGGGTREPYHQPYGVILQTTDGGESWIDRSAWSPQWLWGVTIVGPSHITAVGEGGTILTTSDGGATWVLQHSESDVRLQGVSFTDTLNGIAVGTGGLVQPSVTYGAIYRTTDGGSHWTQQKSKYFFNLFAASLVTPLIGTVVGEDGTILRTTTGGVTAVEPNASVAMPAMFLLNQNYPDPFNPRTRIDYVLPGRAQVRLCVFNVLGQVVATLVNGPQDAGRESAVFDAAALPSGVYLYRLEATSTSHPGKSFSEVRKMILAK